MTYNEKKSLNESIMKDVSKIVKHHIKILKEQHENDNEIDDALSYMEDEKEAYDLAGCELTSEDAEMMIKLMRKGMSKDKAADVVLKGIRDVISQGWEF